MLNFPTDPKSMNTVLGQPGLAGILQRVTQLKILETQLKALLPEELAPHYKMMNLEAGRLVIGAESAAWATRLHYYTPELLNTLNENRRFGTITKIVCRVTD